MTDSSTVSRSSEITTSSDEQYRIIKACNGAQGMLEMDALDEKTNNATDANATYIEHQFDKDGYLEQTYNNGKPMDEQDKKAMLCLDSQSKTNKKNMIGRYGIGNFNSNAILGGKGSVRTTTNNDQNLMQLNINFSHLKDPRQCKTKMAWTGDHPERPKWREITDNSCIYRKGVTQEFLGQPPTNKKFLCNEVIFHHLIKFNNPIEDGLTISIKFGDKQYKLNTSLYNQDELLRKEIHFKIHQNDIYSFEYDSKIYRCGCDGRGIVCKETKKIDEEIITSAILTIQYPYPDHIELNACPQLDTIPKQVRYISGEYVNQGLGNMLNATISETKLKLPCNLEIDIPKDEKPKKAEKDIAIKHNINHIIEKTIPGITINCDGQTLTAKDFDRTQAMSKGGDIGKKDLQKVFLLRFDYKSSEEFNLSQEDKNKVDLPKHLSKGIAKVCSMINDHIMKELKEIYGKACESAELMQESDDNDEHLQENNGDDEHLQKSNGDDEHLQESDDDENTSLASNINLSNTHTRVQTYNVPAHYKGPVEVAFCRAKLEEYISMASENGLIADPTVLNQIEKSLYLLNSK